MSLQMEQEAEALQVASSGRYLGRSVTPSERL